MAGKRPDDPVQRSARIPGRPTGDYEPIGDVLHIWTQRSLHADSLSVELRCGHARAGERGMVNSGDTDFAKLTSQLTADSGRSAYVRVLLRRSVDGWMLRNAWMLVGAEPPGWTEETWQYAELALVACKVSAADLPVLCPKDARGRATISEFEFTVPTARGPVHWRRQPSFARHDRLPLPQPTINFRIAPDDYDTAAWPDGMLVGECCPSFPRAE